MHNYKKNKWFSLVEIIVVISILVLLAFIWLNTQNLWNEKTDNTKTVSDLSTVKNALLSYMKTNSDLPMPWGNNYIYDENWMYSHDWNDDKTYWVSWFITENTLPKTFMNFLPLDNRTKQYYAYAKRKSTLNYQVSWISWKSWQPESYVLGNPIVDQGMIDLVKEYNWPNFVYNKSNQYFPFSTDSRDFTARISNFSWVVLINNNNLWLTWTLDYILREWDRVVTNSWSFATIYFSDWSRAILGDNNTNSDLTLSMMKYEWENNLITKIKLALWWWTVWNDVVKLNQDWSDFQIHTNDVAAAVRWTIFWVRKDLASNNSNVTVKSWKVDLYQAIEQVWTTNPRQTLEVKSWETATWSTIYSTYFIPWTWALQSVDQGYIDSENLYLSDNIATKVVSWDYISNTDFNIVIRLNKVFRNADKLKIRSSTWVDLGYLSNNWKSTGSLILNQNTSIKTPNSVKLNTKIPNDKKLEISFCKAYKSWENCSREFEIVLKIPNFKQEDNDKMDTKMGYRKCPRWYDFIDSYTENFGCVQNSLYQSGAENNQWKVVAFAPYDKPKDLKMYKYQNPIEAYSDAIINNIGGLTEIDDFIKDDNISFYENIKDEIKWIFIDNTGNDDYIKYDLYQLGLKDNFAIELSVRGKALKRTSLTYYLAGWAEYPSKYRLFLSSWNLYFRDISSTSLPAILTWSTYWPLLNDNVFYKVIAKTNSSWCELAILDNKLKIIASATWNAKPILTDDILYVWNQKASNTYEIYKFQWNDIINYVKVYRMEK